MEFSPLGRVAIFVATFSFGACTPVKKPASTPVDFVTEIKPIFEQQCLECHNNGLLLGKFNLESKAQAFTTTDGRAVITPGDPEASPLYVALTLPQDNDAAMPPLGHKLPDEKVELIRRWIEEGADWPEGADGVLKPIVTSDENP
jgi:mono/diheme cytochrome c family protein